MMYFPIHPLFPIFFTFPVFSAASASFEKREGNVPQIQDGFTPLQTQQIMDAFQDVFLMAKTVVDDPVGSRLIRDVYFKDDSIASIKRETSP